MRKVYLIFKKELGAFAVSPIFYGVLTIFLALSGYFFYTDLVLYNSINIRGLSDPIKGLWFPYMNDLRFVFMLMMPLVTMKVFAEEKKLGTYELLTTYPLRDGEILAGKFLASFLVFLIMLALTVTHVLYWVMMWGFHGLRPLLAGYIGLILMGGALVSCGLFISSVTENQSVAGMATLGVFIFFWFLTWNELVAAENVIRVLTRFSLFDRTQGFFKGIIETKDAAFFVLFMVFFLFLTLRSMEARFWRGHR